MAEEEDADVDADVDAMTGRRWTTLFTVTRLGSPEEGEKGSVTSGGRASTRKILPLEGIGGIMRALYMFFWSLDASVFVFWKSVFG